ncbi:MAG: RAMP superfamily CRISPR-associated protein, partial [Anaerolineae bacterium]
MNRLHATIELTLRTALHTTGNRRRFGVDKALALDVEGHPIILATTLKGFLREKAELLLRAWGHKVCTGPEPAHMCDSSQFCLVCRVFGNPCHPSPLRFADARMIAPETPETAVRSGVSISRHRRAAYPQRLFFEETTPPGHSIWHAEADVILHDQLQAHQAASLIL